MSECSYVLLVTLLILSKDGLRGLGGALILTKGDVDNFIGEDARELPEQIHHQFLKTDVTESVPVFTLKVHVKDAVSRQGLSGASVELFVNYVLSSSVLTSEDGSALLQVPYNPHLPITVEASMGGYITTPLPWKASKIPIFSSVTLPLASQTRGNIWLFEDSVLITGKISESLPYVQFPRNLLTVPECNISTITAYLTVPQLTAEKSMGVLIRKSGYRSIELKPIATVSVELRCNSRELQVIGPIMITLPLPDNSGLRVSDPVPAWAFDSKIGAWVNQGLGIVKSQDGVLVWSYTASYLGLWLAAPFPSTSSTGHMGHASHIDFRQNAYLLMAILSGAIIVISGILTVQFCQWRCSFCVGAGKTSKDMHMDLFKRDQTTSTTSMHQQTASYRDLDGQDDTAHKSEIANLNSQTNFPTHSQGRKFNHYVDSRDLPGTNCYERDGNVAEQAYYVPHYIDGGKIGMPEGTPDQTLVPVALSERMFLSERLVHMYNQSVTLVQTAEILSAEQPSSFALRSATLPRQEAGSYKSQAEPLIKHNLTQSCPRALPLSDNHRQRSEEQQVSERSKASCSSVGDWERFNTLLESVSVPGTLNKATHIGPLCGEHQGTSEQNLRELSKSKPSPHPRSWFVSLEGQPVGQVRHSVLDLQKCLHRASETNNTSLDSGVDMNEHVAGGSSRRLERERTFVRSAAPSSGGRTQRLCSATDDVDLSSSESATTTTCTPENPSLRSLLDSAGTGAVPNIPGEDVGTDMSSAQEDSEARSTPSLHRLRKAKDIRRTHRQKSTWLMREEKPLMKLN